MDLTLTGLQGVLAMLLLEGIKRLVARFITPEPINPNYYVLALPFLSLLVLPIASWLLGGAMDFSLWTSDTVRQTALLVISSLAAMVGYNTTISPLSIAIRSFKK